MIRRLDELWATGRQVRSRGVTNAPDWDSHLEVLLANAFVPSQHPDHAIVDHRDVGRRYPRNVDRMIVEIAVDFKTRSCCDSKDDSELVKGVPALSELLDGTRIELQ